MTKHSCLLFLVTFALALVTACGGPSSGGSRAGTPGGDLALLARLGDIATQRVQRTEPGATLQQVDIAPGDGRYEFRFIDPGLSRVVVASGSVGATSPEAFAVAPGVLAGRPTDPIDLGALRVGPDGAVAAAVRELSAASPRSLVLARQDGRLVWRVVVNGPQGIVSGTVPDDTGRFARDTP